MRDDPLPWARRNTDYASRKLTTLPRVDRGSTSAEPRPPDEISSTRSAIMGEDRRYTEKNVRPGGSLNERSPLMDHPQNISKDALRALSYLLVGSIILTLAGMSLIFFSDNIHDVLWESISLIVLGASATVITLLPGSGPYIVDNWNYFKGSCLLHWRYWSCCEFCERCARGTDGTPDEPTTWLSTQLVDDSASHCISS